MKNILSILILSLVVIACNNSPVSQNIVTLQKKEMTISDTSDGWGGDITLSIIKIQTKNDKKILTVISSFKGSDVGFELELFPMPSKNGFHETGMTIKSLGSVSDKLLQALSNIYALKSDTSLKFIDSFSTTYVNLDEMAASLGKTAKTDEVSTKLFLGDTNNENDYGEVYVDFNESEGWVEIAEKDIEYRSAVIKAFSKK